MHELSHLLEADERTFRRAVEFLSRRRAGDPLAVVDSRGDLGRRDKFRDPKGQDMFYPGRVYEATRATDAEEWHRTTLPGTIAHSGTRAVLALRPWNGLDAEATARDIDRRL